MCKSGRSADCLYRPAAVAMTVETEEAAQDGEVDEVGRPLPCVATASTSIHMPLDMARPFCSSISSACTIPQSFLHPLISILT